MSPAALIACGLLLRIHFGSAALWVMDTQQQTLDAWFTLLETVIDRDASMETLLNALLTQLDEIDKSLVDISRSIQDLA